MIPKKSLGQNFLTNAGIVASIADAASLVPGETVLEIGPGKGILTGELLKRGTRVISVEKDDDLMPFLREKLKREIAENRLILIHDDILEINFQFLISNFSPDGVCNPVRNISPKQSSSVSSNMRTGLQTPSGDVSANYKLVANIPYYITGQIIRKFLTAEKQPEKIVLLVQKEVAERIIAKDNKESLLSVSVKAYGKPSYIKTVKAGSFTPAPKVDSAILLIDDISRDFFADISEERFFEILHAGFAHKRKQLFGNLRTVFDEKILREKMKETRIPENIRAEDVSLPQWKKLSEEIG
ncbi:MAG: 16S rRNA (adenine(1518)-N(6)/adenine(1519)-N(6))-dimethyltransferase RsmA [Candidatus Paceibacterota bacterium]|jgi:16S rRNA (adenine1518-N6/adenine1519-N6)-dimethyltransferase